MIYGSTLPRLYTPPLDGRQRGKGCTPGCSCGLTSKTSHGFAVVAWSRKTLGIELNPWQRWLLIHGLELDAACERYRFTTVLVLVARQNGKTKVKAILTLWRMFEQGERYLVGTAQDLSQAREVMNEVLVPMILDVDEFEERFAPDHPDQAKRRGIWHKTLNDEYIRLDSEWRGGRALGPHGPRYLIKAMNRKAGRGMANVAEVNIDELREQQDHLGWASVSKTVMANPDAQIWCMSNAGDKKSVVLNHLRGVALSGADPTLFHAEWSAIEGCPIEDEDYWPDANPSLGYTLRIESLRSSLQTDPPNVFRTEVLCQNVDVMNTAIDTDAWASCADAAGLMPDGVQPALCFEAAVDGSQVVCVAGWNTADGRVRFHLAGVWESSTAARNAMRDLRTDLRPRAMGWFSVGPGSTLGATMRKLGGVPISGNAVAEACMTFADHVDGRRVTHSDDPLVNMHVAQTGTIGTEAKWTFDRTGATHATWAAAGALHLVLNQPEPVRRRRRVLVPSDEDLVDVP